MDELERSLTVLQEKLDENQKRMTNLSQKLDDTQIRLGGRMEMISELLSAATKQAAVVTPGEIYRTAENDYLAGKLDLAISNFKDFIERYPNSDLVDSARFYLADSYLQKKNFQQALAEFDKVAGASREYRPRALLKRSYVLDAMKSPVAQRETLKTLIQESPDSPEAQTAQQILKELEKGTPKETAPKKKTQ